MRKQLLFLFICFVTIPVIIIYSVATAIFNEKTDENLRNIYSNDIKNIAQIAENYFAESIDLTMYPLLENSLYSFFTASSDSEDFVSITSQASAVLNSSPYVFGGLRGVVLMRKDGNQIATHSNYISNAYITEEQMEKADLLNGKCFWEFMYDGSSSLFSITRLIKSKSNLAVPLGYIQTSVSSTELRNQIQSAIIEKNSIYYIIDDSGNILLSSNNNENRLETTEKYDYAMLSQIANSHTSTVLDGNQFISAQPITDSPYLICSIITSDMLASTRSTLISILTSVSVFTAFFFALLASIFSRRIVRPIHELSAKMDSISNENFSVRATVRGNDEITILANQFNKMSERLEYLYSQVYMQEIELKRSQLLALQSQINPHFLYNTMDTIYWMSKIGNMKDIENIVSSMSKLLRLTFTPDSNNVTTLAEELEHLKAYMDIQRIRYGDSIQFILDYKDSFDDLTVLRFLLQPLVENALVHGLKDRPNETIIIAIYRKENSLIYQVKNTGTPLDPEFISSLLSSDKTEKKGFAIRNIDRRLKLKYGNNCGLICFIEKEYNIFEIRQPIF